MQLILENPAHARALGVEPPTGLLLYGPPGTGKTTIARVLADQARCRFFSTSPAEVNNMWMGESEKSVAQTLQRSPQAAAPSIIFLDEVDALVGSRAGGMMQYSDKVVNQFLHEMDGIKRQSGRLRRRGDEPSRHGRHGPPARRPPVATDRDPLAGSTTPASPSSSTRPRVSHT